MLLQERYLCANPTDWQRNETWKEAAQWIKSIKSVNDDLWSHVEGSVRAGTLLRHAQRMKS
ncbi:hypothetical protein PGT21_002705 [Puccinia graminis f. sp. tritici]|uniref:Uncharacterized protein n=1 Tax=Puccinia graminis f. sp. tritici TaxID=56615 RepID=A0A5B0LSK9_PUCGR|nr:hypothetical protein PGT21_002705 [Puccinia graminis f. sp. tritici]KAA1137853.1 hypothetical protein PGTUg99_025846 [Puccinia graminis f. sp. tritici]